MLFLTDQGTRRLYDTFRCNFKIQYFYNASACKGTGEGRKRTMFTKLQKLENLNLKPVLQFSLLDS